MSSISRLIIDQQMAEIGVKVTPAQMHITTPRPEMDISFENAQMTVERQNPHFTINREKINNESGLAQPLKFTRDIAGLSENKAMQAVAGTSREGDFLGKTERPGNRVAQLSRHKNLQTLQKEANIGLMPKSIPEIEWDPGYVRINWSGHKVKIEWEGEYMPQMVIDPPYSVEVFLRTQPYFRITVEEAPDPFMAGQVVDESL